MNAWKQDADAGMISLELDGGAYNNQAKEHMRDDAWIGVDINTGVHGAYVDNENGIEYYCSKAILYDGGSGTTESWCSKSQSHMISMETQHLRLEQGRVSESVFACVSEVCVIEHKGSQSGLHGWVLDW